MKRYPRLSDHQSQVLSSILYGPSKGADPIKHKGSTRPITEKLIKKYFNFFNGDADEIRSICSGAALDAVVIYSKKPPEQIYKLAVRMMINRILNASKALSRKKRGGGVYHAQVESDANGRQSYGWHNIVTHVDGMQDCRWDVPARDKLEFEMIKNFAPDNPLENAIAQQALDRREEAEKVVILNRRARSKRAS